MQSFLHFPFMSLSRTLLLLFSLFIAGGALFAEGAQTNQKRYTIEECISLAKQNNQTIATAEAKIEGAIADKNEARSAFLPFLSVEGLWDNNNQSLAGDLTQFQNFNTSTAVGITAKLAIWDFGSSLNRLKAGRVRIDASKMKKDYTFLVVEEQVRTAYLKILEKEKFVDVIQSSFTTLSQQLKTSEQLHKQGIAKTTDVLTVQVQLASEEKKLLQAKNEVLRERMSLNYLIGLPISEIIVLEDVAENAKIFSVDQVTKYALEHRPDFLAMQKELKALQHDKRAAQLSMAPQFYAFANGNYSYAEDHKAAASAGIGLKIDLYKGGMREATIDKIDSQIQVIKASLQDLHEMIFLEINNTSLRFEEIQKSFQIDKQAISLAKENLENTMKLYEQGILSINDVLISEEQLKKVKMNYYYNLYTSHIACVHLITITGGYPLQ